MVKSLAITLVPLALITRVVPSNGHHLRLVRDDDPNTVLTTHDVIRLWVERCHDLRIDGQGDAPLADSTIAGVRSAELNLFEHLPDVDAASLDAATLRTAILDIAKPNGRRGGKYAARAACMMFGAAWKYAVESRKLPLLASPTVDPIVRRSLSKPRRRSDTFVESDVLSAIIDTSRDLADANEISTIAARAIEVAARLGQRVKSDILPLQIGCVIMTPKGPVLRLRSRKARGKMFRLPLPPEVHAVLLECEANARNGWLFPGGRDHCGRKGHLTNVYGPWKVVMTTLLARGIDVTYLDGDLLVPHQTRHGFATHCLDAGIHPREIGLAICQSNDLSIWDYAARAPNAPAAPAFAYEKILRGNRPMTTQAPESTYHERLCAAMLAIPGTAKDGGMSAADLAAELTEAGYRIGKRMVEMWRAGSSQPPLDAYKFLCPILKCTADYLILGVSNG
jgi:integrase